MRRASAQKSRKARTGTPFQAKCLVNRPRPRNGRSHWPVFLPASRLDERRGAVRVEIMAAAIVPACGTQVEITRDLVGLRAIYEPIHARRIARAQRDVVSVAP